MVAQCSSSDRERAEQRVVEFNVSEPSRPDAEGIADNGGDENGEHKCPAAKVVIEVHRTRLASNGPKPGPARRSQRRERKLCALLLALDVTYDGFTYMGDKVIE
jgi:hypothetical protein